MSDIDYKAIAKEKLPEATGPQIHTASCYLEKAWNIVDVGRDGEVNVERLVNGTVAERRYIRVDGVCRPA